MSERKTLHRFFYSIAQKGRCHQRPKLLLYIHAFLFKQAVYKPLHRLRSFILGSRHLHRWLLGGICSFVFTLKMFPASISALVVAYRMKPMPRLFFTIGITKFMDVSSISGRQKQIVLPEYVVKIVSGGGGIFQAYRRIFHKLMQG